MSTQYNLGKVVGSDATINGYNAITMTADDGVTMTRNGSQFNFSAPGIASHTGNTNNPHSVTKDQIGLGNVANKTPADILSMLETDASPASGSSKPVQSGGVFTALAGKQDNLTFDNTPSSGSNNPVKSGGIYDALATKQPTLHGRESEVVGFDANGNAVPRLINAVEEYIFTINDAESVPTSKIAYLGKNAGYTPFTMNMSTGVPNYGNWGDAFFMKGIRPCLLNFDGTIAYDLDKNDYSKKADGVTPATINDLSVNANVMVGIPTVWIKLEKSGDLHTIHVSNTKLDDSYHAWAHTDKNGVVKPYVFLPAYNGYTDSNSRQRSISGVQPTRSTTAGQEMTRCGNLNTAGGVTGWQLEDLAQRMLINILLMLIGKSTNTQATFGQGNSYGYYDDPKPADKDTYGVLQTGTMDDKGLFYGKSVNNVGVKVFGIENWWGNIWRRCAGFVNDNGVFKIKMTKSPADGSSVSSYNDNGNGYIDISNIIPPISASSSPIYSLKPVSSYGVFISATGADQSYHYADALWTNNAQNNFVLFGGDSNGSVLCGAFACGLDDVPSDSGWDIGGAPSFL